MVRPDGTVAVMFWSSQQLLPGHPDLEARLNRTQAGLAPALMEWPATRHPLRAFGWMQTAGLKERKAATFVAEIRSPLDETGKEALAAIIQMRWGRPMSELTDTEWAEFERLLDRRGPDSIVDAEDYYGFFTYSLFWGKVPAKAPPADP